MKAKPEAAAGVFTSPEGRERILKHYESLLAGFRFPYREEYVQTGFGPTYLLVSGPEDKPPLLLFHGSSSNSAAWFSDIGELSKHFLVMAVDLIGDAGHSAQARPDMKSGAHAEWIHEILQKKGISRASLMGNSLGAWMCLTFASAYPEMADRVVLLAASGIKPVRLSFVLRLILFSLRGGMGAEKITEMVYGKDKIPQEVKEYIALISQNYRPYTGAIPLFSDEELARLTMPVLYIAGEVDRLTSAPGSARRLQKLLPRAEVCLLPNRGHVIYDVLDRIVPFLQGG